MMPSVSPLYIVCKYMTVPLKSQPISEMYFLCSFFLHKNIFNLIFLIIFDLKMF